MTDGEKTFAKPVSFAIPLIVAAVMIIVSVLCQRGGSLHYEIEKRLPFYLSEKPLIQKVFDSEELDSGMYQARELSYAFDYIDCKVIAASVALGWPHFLSFTYYAFLLLISLVLWKFGAGDLKLDWRIVVGVILLFWTTPAVFWGGTFFRTSKIGVALLVVLLIRQVWRTLRLVPSVGPGWKTIVECFFLGWLMTLFDRQGVYFTGVIGLFLACWHLFYRDRMALKLGCALAAAVVLSVMYNYVIAPCLTLWQNHYWPDFKYQHLPWGALKDKPGFFTVSAWSVYFDNVGFFLGNIPAWASITLVCVLGWAAFGGKASRSKAAATLFVCETILIWFMILLMAVRHGAILWEDVRRVYYFLPVMAIFAITLLMIFAWLPAFQKWPGWVRPAIVFAALLGNAIALPGHKAVLDSGSGRTAHEFAPKILAALRHVRDSNYSVPPDVATNRVFQFFRKTLPPEP